MKECSKCKIKKDFIEFGKNSYKKDGYQDYCKTCKKICDKNFWVNNKDKWTVHYIKKAKEKSEIVKNLRKTKHCEKCKDDRWYVLDFHHLDSKNKKFNIGGSSRKGMKSLMDEIKKCILLCRNCHTEFHYLEKEKNINISDYINSVNNNLNENSKKR